MNKKKILGQVFTPNWVIKLILDELDFNNEKILNKKIIDPACGDCRFLIEIANRIIKQSIKNNLSITKIKNILETNIYGIEIDNEIYYKCINNLNSFIKEKLNKNLNINWNIYNDNTLIKYKNFKNFFDYVVGNPPYIRLHNLDENTKKIIKNNFKFNQGTLDIYLSFFELGLEMLKENGILGYITPNSYLKNSSYKNFRKFLKNQKKIKTLINFKSNKIFKNISTYTCITIIDNNYKKEYFEYKELINNEIVKINNIKFNDLDDNNWSLGNKNNLFFINKLKNFDKKIADYFDVQYGFATLRDNIFINKIIKEKNNYVLFNGHWIEKDILKKIVKGTTYKGNNEYEYIIFPYKLINNKLISLSEEELKKNYPNAYQYLKLNKNELLKRKIEKNKKWFELGRSQGLKNCNKEKIVINNIVKDKINYYFLNKDIYVYSGIFITKKKETIDWEIIKKILESKEFFKYIRLTGKDLSNEYKSLSTKLIKEFPILY